MALAGIDTGYFAPHSIRGASTSAAKRGGATVQQIIETVGWSSASTFARFYDRPVSENSNQLADLGNKTV